MSSTAGSRVNGRNPLQLVILTAGAAATDAATIPGQQDNRGVTVNGLRATDNNYRLDGATFNNRHFGSAPTLPNPDALQEFTVKAANFNAEDTGAGAVVQLSTRSGTNELHGSVFEVLRNEKLDARNFFAARRSPFKRNQFGGSLGGAIVENKTFYFVSYQGTKQRASPSPKTITVPSLAQRQGDFSKINKVIADPLSKKPFPNNRIPDSRFDPFAVALLDVVPLPNQGENLVVPRDSNQDDDQFLLTPA